MRTLLLALGAIALAAADPCYVDLAPVANAAAIDDGIPDNGAGGWTDEGINDMRTFPALAAGVQEANGIRFRILDPAATGGNQVLLLRGARGAARPATAAVAVPGARGRFLYFVHHGIARPSGMGKEEVVARYTVRYADGQTAVAEMRDGRELRHWWTGAWWDNNGPEAWPVLMGQNPYTAKWNKWIGLWATCWSNPRPEQPIAGIEFASAGRVMPALWAVTIDDRDYRGTLPEGFRLPKPAGVPAGWFADRLALERGLIARAMRDAGLMRGIRDLVVVAPDLLAVTLDSAVSGGPGYDATAAAALQDPGRFALSAGGAARRVAQVGRFSFRAMSRDVGRFPVNQLFWHTCYLRLEQPLAGRADCTLAIAGLPEGSAATATAAWDDATSITPAIKVNQVAYAAASRRRYAYLGFWAGDLGAIDLSAFTSAEVVAEDGRAVARLPIEPRPPTAQKDAPKGSATAPGVDHLSGERVAQIDLATVPPGRYHLRVPGLGRSWPFAIGGDDERKLARTVIRALLTQRCGCELPASATGFPRPACHVRTWEHGPLVGGVEERWKDGALVQQNPPLRPDEPSREFRGGYHDAGDFDIFAGHLAGTARLLAAYEAAPGAWSDGDLGLPESGNGIPDLLDEAAWNLRFYAENQEADGGIPAGRGNDEDYMRTDWPKDGGKEFGPVPRWGLLPPTRASSAIFAAVAAQWCRLAMASDPARAKDWLARAGKAFDYALRDGGGDYRTKGITYASITWQRALFCAAAELWETTGEARYHDYVLQRRADKEVWSHSWQSAGEMPFFRWPYARAARSGADADLQRQLRQEIIRSADGVVNAIDQRSYRMAARADGAGGWGDLVGGANYGSVCMLAWQLTRDRKYLDAASLSADYQLGANPLGVCFITSMGGRAPSHPLVRPWLYHGERAVAGIAVYGPGGGPGSMGERHPLDIPRWRCWSDDTTSIIHAEFDLVRQCTTAQLYALLWSAGQDRRP